MKVAIILIILLALSAPLLSQPLNIQVESSDRITFNNPKSSLANVSIPDTLKSYDESYKVGSHDAEYLTRYLANLGYGFGCGLTLGFIGVAVNQWTVKPTKLKNIPAGTDSTGYADGFKTKSHQLNKRSGLVGSLFGTAAQTIIIVSIIHHALHNMTSSK